MTTVLSSQLPDGPWRALIGLTSGLTIRHAEATIRFPGSAVKAKAAISGYLILAAILIVILILVLICAWLIRRHRRSPPAPGQLAPMLTHPGRHADNP